MTEGVWFGNIICDDHPMSSSVVTLCDSTKPLLTSSIPDLQLAIPITCHKNTFHQRVLLYMYMSKSKVTDMWYILLSNNTYLYFLAINFHSLEHKVYSNSISMTLNIHTVFEPLHCTCFPHSCISYQHNLAEPPQMKFEACNYSTFWSNTHYSLIHTVFPRVIFTTYNPQMMLCIPIKQFQFGKLRATGVVSQASLTSTWKKGSGDLPGLFMKHWNASHMHITK